MTETLQERQQDDTADNSELQTDDFEQAYGQFRTEVDGHECFMAGIPGYEGKFFGRDGILSGLLDQRLLNSALDVSELKQGTKYDPQTGEEPGKILHEWPGADLADKGIEGREGHATTYNACDTTALYLIGHEFKADYSPNERDEQISNSRESMERAVDYILSHVGDDNLFREFPPEGADKFALRITYWKDSVLPDANGGKKEPEYPVMYGLAHFMNARGLLAAARLLDREDLEEKAHEMFQAGITHCMRKDGFLVAEDATSRIEQPSSDELHALAYIPEEYADMLPLDAIRERAKVLETDAGYACTPKAIASQLEDGYHGDVVWPFENAFIHHGAVKFGLSHETSVAERPKNHLEKGNELIEPSGKKEESANERQLWSVATSYYFSHPDSFLRTTNTL